MSFVCLLVMGVSAGQAEPSAEEREVLAAVARLGGAGKLDATLGPTARVDVTVKSATDATLFALAKLPNVGAITIGDATRCTEKGYDALRELPDLQRLVLSKSAVNDRAAAVVGSIRPLQELYLGEARLTDAGLAAFKGRKHLRVLDLYRTAVTDKGVEVLATIKTLEDLNLSGTRITDKSIDLLAGLPSLKLVRLNGTGVTRAGVTRLEMSLPKATVRW